MPSLDPKNKTRDESAPNESVRNESVRNESASGSGTATHWRSLSDLVAQAEAAADGTGDGGGDAAVDAYLEQRIPDHDELFGDPLSRRRFMQIMGASVALSGAAGLTGCRWEEDHIIPESQRPEDYVPGVPKKYATSMSLGGAGYGLLVTAYDGRPIKVDGNPDHPNTGRGSTSFVQASLLELYDPDRSRVVERRRGRKPLPANWSDFDDAAVAWTQQHSATKGQGLRVLSEATTSPTILALRDELLRLYPQARWHEYEPLSRDNERAGTRIAFGRALRVQLQLAEARIIAAFDADLFGDHPDCLRLARDFATGRDPDENPTGMNRLYAVESGYSVTGGSADHRLPLRSELIKPFLMALEAKLQGGSPPPASKALADAKLQKFLSALAGDLIQNRGRSVIAVGPTQPPEVHALVARLNGLLGNSDTVVYTAEPDPDRPHHNDDIVQLASDMRKGAVDTLLILGGNPAYDAPADLDFAGALDQVDNSIHLSVYSDETSQACNWHVPRAHYLEAWGDTRTHDGTVTIAQPIVEPIFGGRSAIDVLKQFVGRGEEPAEHLVRAQILGAMGVTDPRPSEGEGAQEAHSRADTAWRRALHDGFAPRTAFATEKPQVQPFTLAPLTPTQGEARLKNGSLEVVFTVNTSTYDGRFANNAWLQEVPDFLTKMTWDNAALISPRTAADLGVKHEQMLEITLDGRALKVVAYVMPGQAPFSIALAVGQGRRRAGRVGGLVEEGIVPVGFDAYRLRSSKAPMVATGGNVRGLRDKYRLSLTVDHYNMDKIGQDGIAQRIPDLVREATLEDYKKPGYDINEEAHSEDIAILSNPTKADRANRSLFKEPRYDGYKWGMTTDLSKCTGCNACIIACQAENNIPVVGKEQVWRNREMHWLRIDRYFQGDPDDPRIAHQPVLCQQCENAPCEQVCPVGATLHSEEGLNDMAYNRCVGTRYCLNNCPYRVRRFNFLRWDWYKEMDEPRAQVRKLLFNPDVTVRSRGVMEKCTFCVQRIQNAKIQAKNNRVPIEDGVITTACQDACPTGAIVFGDLNDRRSRVAALHARPRAYAMLAELNARPRNVFLARIRNPHPELG
ncbi:MAG TPA: 4Fe-4S dicluster domain-containing protein [Kofleriaceae bacterium]|nr:4Fe-4S dicluster domain-containing protein [Kofleriaceae bacterium]